MPSRPIDRCYRPNGIRSRHYGLRQGRLRQALNGTPAITARLVPVCPGRENQLPVFPAPPAPSAARPPRRPQGRQIPAVAWSPAPLANDGTLPRRGMGALHLARGPLIPGNHEFQTGPDLIDRADLDIDEAQRK